MPILFLPVLYIRSPSPSLKHRHRPRTNKSIQTGLDLGDFVYQWNPNSLQTLVAGYGPSFVDPTPIATHVVSADALEGTFSMNSNELICLFMNIKLNRIMLNLNWKFKLSILKLYFK